MMRFEEMDARLQRLGKDRKWLVERTPYRMNSIRQALSPNSGGRSDRLREILSRAIEEEEASQLETEAAIARAIERPGLHEIFHSSAELDQVDRASRAVNAASLVDFCRETLLAQAREILRRRD